MKNLIFIFVSLTALAAFSASASAQAACPDGMVCLSQQAANAAASNARELAATKVKVTELQTALDLKDATIKENKDAAAKNEADLKAALVKTQTDLATATGQLIEAKAQTVRDAAIMDVLLKNTRSKCMPFSICIGH